MLQTNNTTILGHLIQRRLDGTASYLAAYVKEHMFVVNPSPCNNGGDETKPHAYSFTKTDTRHPRGSGVDFQGSADEVLWSGFCSGYKNVAKTLTCVDHSNTINNRALSKLYGSIRNADINLATTIGEGRETLDLLTGVYSKAALLNDDFYRAKRQGKKAVIAGFRNPLQTVGGIVLLVNLAIKPLLADIEGLRKHALTEKIRDVEFQVSGRASAVDMKKIVRLLSGAEISETRNRSQRIEYGLTYKITDLHAFENWRAGLTLRPTLAWELTTLSFLVDYFFKVGEYLELLEASFLNNGITFVHGYKTVTERDAWHASSIKNVPDVPQVWLRNGHNFTQSEVITKKTRTVLSSFPAPARPTVKIPKASTQLLNCAALLSQLIGKR